MCSKRSALGGGISVNISGKAPLTGIGVLACVAVAGLLVFFLIPKRDRNAPSPIVRPTTLPTAPKDPSTLPAGSTTEEMKTEVVEVAGGLVENLLGDANAMALAAGLYDTLGKSAESTECWRKCLKISPNRADACSQLGWAAVKRGEYEQAAVILRRAVALDAGMTGAHHALACALMSLGEHDEAISNFEKEIEIAPRAVQSHYMLAQALQQLGRYKAAERSYQAVLGIQPNNKNALYGLMTVLMRLGKKTQAAEHRRRYAELTSTGLKTLIKDGESYDDRGAMRELLISAHIQAGNTYARARSGDRAEKHWRRAFAIEPGNVPSRLALAGWLQTVGRPSEALEICKELTTVQPNNGAHWINVGFLHAKMSQSQEAEKALRTAVRVDPKNPRTHSTLAILFLRGRRNSSEARRLAHKAVTLDPSAANYALLGRAHLANGDKALAKAAMRRAVEKDPANSKYRQILQAIQGGR